ncbi:MAG TPA: hypothetical protein VEJ23_03680 [Solirubrobacteraceae bacterium]|nr:hypothetical protein [Solirubrobacteraceae bacterium]
MDDAELAALWRRHFDVLDQLVYGFLEGLDRASLSEQRRAETRGDEKGVVSVDQLRARRYKLATVLYYGADTPEGFAVSDPLDKRYVGQRESRLLRDRRELDGQL